MFGPLLALGLLLILGGLIMMYGVEGLVEMLAEGADPLVEYLEDLIGLTIVEEALQILGLIL